MDARHTLTQHRGSPLLHPLWWGSLVVLVVNDHLLKGAGLLPVELTGKLSDFAGMIVAPVLLAVLLGARTPTARAACFAAVASVFAAINVSTGAAQALEQLSAAVGVPWIVVTDPTDLIGLLALPVAWHVAAVGSPARAGRGTERLALAVGLLACAASTPPSQEGFSTANFLANRTQRPVDVRVRWLDADMSCAEVSGRAGRALSRDLFGEGITMRLEPGTIIPLDEAAVLRATGGGGGAFDPWGGGGDAGAGCEAAILSVDGMDDRLVFWSGFPQFVPAEVDGTVWGGTDLNVIEGDLAAISRSSSVEVYDVIDVEPGVGCTDPVPGLGWSVVPPEAQLGPQILEGWELRPDHCLELGFSDPELADSAWRMNLCAPATDIPFAPGESVRVVERELEGGGRVLQIQAGAAGSSRELVVVAEVGEVSRGGIAGELVTLDCEGHRVACGGFELPVAVRFEGVADPVRPGRTIELPTDDGRDARLTIGGARRAVVATPGCGVGQGEIGSAVDYVMIVGERP